MADSNQLISLGIGSPADIEHFILYGLNISPVTAAPSTAVELDLLTAVGTGLAMSTAGVGLALTTVKGAGGLTLTTERQNT